MASPSSPQLLPAVFKFGRNREFLGGAGSAGIQVTAVSDLDVLRPLLTEDQPFPDREIEIGKVSLAAETPRPIEFGMGQGRVKFKANAGAFAGFGIYPDASRLAAELTPNRSGIPVQFETIAGETYALLRWGFDAGAHLNGAMALGVVGKAVLGVDASTESLFAVVRRLPKTEPARRIVQRTVESWMLPRQVDSADHLQPGTWLIAEVDGSIGVKLGAQLGYDFNWIRETELEGLQGDLGLRLQLAVSATAGFTASGKHAVVVSRPTADPVLRLQLFKLSGSSLNLALNAGAVAQPIDTVLPRKADDLIRAVFQLHGAQVIEQLKVVEKWTDPEAKLADLLAGAGVEQATRLIAHLGGVTVDQLQSSFDALQQTAVRFITQWRTLDHRISTLLLKFAEEKVDLSRVRRIAEQVRAATEPEGLRKLLEERLREVDFFQTPEGRWLEAMAADGVLNLLSRPVQDVRRYADLTLGILDGSKVEEVLGRFQQYLEDQLNVGRLLDSITETDFAALDGLLKKRLGEFLDKTFEFEDVDRIRTAVHLLLEKRQEFYEKALKALHRSYQAEFVATYQRVRQDEALLDINFDFRENSTGVQKFLRLALRGEFDDLLTTAMRGVSLNLASLSHKVRRQTHVELTLPYYNFRETHINESIATVKAMEEQGGVLVYDLNTRDSVVSNRRNSTLAVGAHIALQKSAGGDVRLHSAQPPTYRYSLRQAIKNMERADLEYQLGPVIDTYFPALFADRPFARWLDYLDRRTEEEIPNTPDFFGSTLLSLDVSLSAEDAGGIGALWFRLPKKKNAEPYLRMSLSIQRALKTLIPFAYFHNPEKYADLTPARLLLAYAAIPAVHRVTLGPGNAPKVDTKGLYWDWRDLELRRAMLARMPQTLVQMEKALHRVSRRLEDTPGFESLARDYAPQRAASILGSLSTADDGASHVSRLYSGLLQAEGIIIDEAQGAGKAIAEFREIAPDKPSRALKKLAEFGSKLTDAFNNQVSSTYLDGTLRPLGTQVFLAASRALGEDQLELRQNAMLSLCVMRRDWKFEPQNFITEGTIPDADVVVRERLVSL